MKKLILTLAIALFIGAYSQAQTTLVWELESNEYITGNDTMKEVLYTFIPRVDAKNVEHKFLFRIYKNREVRYQEWMNWPANLDSIVSYNGQDSTYLEWLDNFISIDVNYMKAYMREIFYQKVDPDTLIITP